MVMAKNININRSVITDIKARGQVMDTVTIPQYNYISKMSIP